MAQRCCECNRTQRAGREEAKRDTNDDARRRANVRMQRVSEYDPDGARSQGARQQLSRFAENGVIHIANLIPQNARTDERGGKTRDCNERTEGQRRQRGNRQ